MDGSGSKGNGEKEEEVAGWPTPRATESNESIETQRARESRGVKASKNLYPLAPSTKGRTGILKGAGNAIVPQVGAVFVRAFMEGEEPCMRE
jgi:hypothetical protein